ncbi:MAG: DinB family protein [Acetobacteraceae bacterium]
MITPGYVRTMAAYNAEMNHRLYAAADRLGDAERRADRGAFWSSIHGTLCHLVWGDQIWMSRFAGWPKPPGVQRDSAAMIADWDELRRARVEADAGITAWAAAVDEAWLAGDLTWFSGGAQKELRRPRALLLMHFFNHQTHHRGQAHALLTAAGQETGATDLMVLVRGTE